MGKYSEFSRNQFSVMLEYYRIQKGLTRAELAQKSDLSAPAITNYENGKREPTLSKFNDLANALGLADPILFFVNENVKSLLSNCYIQVTNDGEATTDDRDIIIAELTDKLHRLSNQELQALTVIVASMAGQ